MYLDFHTHFGQKNSDVRTIQNIIIGRDDVEIEAGKWYSAGIHPWYIREESLVQDLDFLWDFAKKPEVKLIGEAGWDKIRGAAWNTQESVFREQIRIAESVNKPMVIHCVRAYNELVSLNKVLRPKIPVIIHGFNKKVELSRELISNGFYLSFGAALLDNVYTQQALKTTPSDRIFLETDDRDDVTIQAIYEKASTLLAIDKEQLEEEIYNNFLAL